MPKKSTALTLAPDESREMELREIELKERRTSEMAAFAAMYKQYRPITDTHEFNCLFAQYKQTEDPELSRHAMRTLLEGNIGLLFPWARYYARTGRMDMADLLQEGLTNGLPKALERFDQSYGCKFSTFASHWIKQSMRRALLKTTWQNGMRLKGKAYPGQYLIRKLSNIHYAKYGRDPTAEELFSACQEFGREKENKFAQRLTLEDVRKFMIRIREYSFSLDQPVHEEEWDSISQKELVSDQDGFDAATIYEAKRLLEECRRIYQEIEDFLSTRNERNAAILRERLGLYGQVVTLEELGLRFGITRERVRQIETKEMKLLSQRIEISIERLAAIASTVEELQRILFANS